MIKAKKQCVHISDQAYTETCMYGFILILDHYVYMNYAASEAADGCCKNRYVRLMNEEHASLTSFETSGFS